ncbi:hypothetical protein DSO57_1000091 [Entomophthora muscae]|uniref:Uncharacterized protein n=1 Tax=Entomophthora muscae TaxID=34485 RepID=A0ACC2SN30_9FUNG|nr:hypothetical protein DSO57_1000091 [Entomophthora muscae]
MSSAQEQDWFVRWIDWRSEFDSRSITCNPLDLPHSGLANGQDNTFHDNRRYRIKFRTHLIGWGESAGLAQLWLSRDGSSFGSLMLGRDGLGKDISSALGIGRASTCPGTAGRGVYFFKGLNFDR